MVLAAFGIDAEEEALEASAKLQEKGLLIDDLERLAREHGLIAQVQETTIGKPRDVLAEGKPPIAYVDRSVFDPATNLAFTDDEVSRLFGP